MGDFFTGNLVSYKNGKMDIIASGFRGADAIEQDGDMLYVSSWPLGKVWSYNLATQEKRELKGDFTTAADFYLDRTCLLYTSPSPRDQRGSRMPSSA